MMLQELAPDLFVADGLTVSFFGFPYPTRMVVVRLPNGNSWVWSPTELSDELVAEVEAVGPVRHMEQIVPLFMGNWAEKYPNARVYSPPGLAKRRKDLKFSAELGDEPEDEWKECIDQVLFTGSWVLIEYMFFHKPSKTVIVGDLIQRMEKVGGLKGFIMRMDSLIGDHGSTPRDWRCTFLRRKAARAAGEKAIAWQPERLVVAHGSCPEKNVDGVLARALSWM